VLEYSVVSFHSIPSIHTMRMCLMQHTVLLLKFLLFYNRENIGHNACNVNITDATSWILSLLKMTCCGLFSAAV
jgi:hypothetical protein